MYDHIGLRVKNVATSVRFYEASLTALGHVLSSADDNGAGFGPAGAPAFWLYRHKGSHQLGSHVAFQAPDREAVDRFYRNGLEAGGRDNGPPGLRVDYAPTYYAAFLIDPDGNNVEAVCMK
jgi:catechol 2,3-dioxygenase-like lactoylglutathione lyase family enzyme